MRAVDWMEDGGRLDCLDYRDRWLWPMESKWFYEVVIQQAEG